MACVQISTLSCGILIKLLSLFVGLLIVFTVLGMEPRASLAPEPQCLFIFYLCMYVFVCVWFWSLKSRSTPSATSPGLFRGGELFFEIGTSLTICLGWLQTSILLISAS
jgi:hypothetical protein